MFSLLGFIFTVVTSLIHIISYACYSSSVLFWCSFFTSFVMMLLAFCAWYAELPFFWVLLFAMQIVLCQLTNYSRYFSNVLYIIQVITTVIIAVLHLFFHIKERQKRNQKSVYCIWSMAFSISILLSIWGGNIFAVKQKDGDAQIEIWAVPSKYDQAECQEKGIIESLEYLTKAYASDERKVKKRAYVYLPYGYDSEKTYNILYLLHGTGDREDDWLIQNHRNKIMLDQLIYHGDISPLIVVTPTWYVEDDCSDELDKLTYTFQLELKNDLMVAVESNYATYAKKCTKEGFIESRNHRAFAGLSRGSATVWHSGYNGALDYFSYFGCFSGFLTSKEEVFQGALSKEYASYDINYFYNSTGSFDFLAKEHLQGFSWLFENDPRLTKENSCFDVFPMRYHSHGNWHIALYNFLQKIF